MLAIAIGVFAAVLFAVVTTSGEVRYADGTPRFLEQIEVRSSQTIRTDSTSRESGATEREDTELSPFVKLALRITR